MIYKDGIWVREYIHNEPEDKQAEIRAEITEAYEYFGYSGKKLDDAVEEMMSVGEIIDAATLIGSFKWAKDMKDGKSLFDEIFVRKEGAK